MLIFFQLRSEKYSEILSEVSSSAVWPVIAGTCLFHSFHHTNYYKQLSVYSCALIMVSNPGWWANSERSVRVAHTDTLITRIKKRRQLLQNSTNWQHLILKTNEQKLIYSKRIKSEFMRKIHIHTCGDVGKWLCLWKVSVITKDDEKKKNEGSHFFCLFSTSTV